MDRDAPSVTPIASVTLTRNDVTNQSKMTAWRIVSFGMGHFYNDMCASMWFTYLLIFATRVLNISSAKAGLLILIGQVADALFTPLIGYESDRRDVWPCCLLYGRRKMWHFVGKIYIDQWPSP